MATAQTVTRKSSRGNGQDKKVIAARAAKEELQAAQDAAETFVSALKSSAGHFTEHLGRAAEEKASLAQDSAKAMAEEAQNVRMKLEDKVRERPLTALGIAAGAGVLLALLSRR